MITVSISAYNDAELLDGCLRSVRDVLGDVPVQVVDGRYAAWPTADDNSTDDTPAVCARYGAAYDAAGPFEREESKWAYRRDRAPDGAWCLFLDTDERVIAFDPAGLRPETPLKVRFHNPVVYHETRPVFYYPRVYQPEWVASYTRTDLPEFRAPYAERLHRHGQTDAVTIAHRHDLRDDDYRRDKLTRYEAEERGSPYGKDTDVYLAGPEPTELDACPACGEASLRRTRETAYGPENAVSRVATCINGECYTAVEPVEIGEHRYVPDDIETGYDEDPDRLRLELLDTGINLLTYYHVHDFHPDILTWMVENDPTRDEWPVTVG